MEFMIIPVVAFHSKLYLPFQALGMKNNRGAVVLCI